MFYNSDEELKNIVENAGTTIILEKNTEKLEKILKNPMIFECKLVDEFRDIKDLTATKTAKNRYFIFKNAENMTVQAQNAALKLFEEPKENYHFILQTTQPEALLPTIRSRAFIYAPKRENALETPPEAEKEVFETAKRLLVADTRGIIEIAEEIQKKKDTEKSPRRVFALKVLETTIELAEKSYYKTGNKAFTKKLNGLIIAHKNIKENGIIRLQIVANLV